MKYVIAGLLLMLPVFILAFTTTHKPDFNHTHDAFICNGTICRDKMSVLPVSWQRYVSLP